MEEIVDESRAMLSKFVPLKVAEETEVEPLNAPDAMKKPIEHHPLHIFVSIPVFSRPCVFFRCFDSYLVNYHNENN